MIKYRFYINLGDDAMHDALWCINGITEQALEEW